MKKVTIAKMDRLWSEYIRARDGYQCIVCGKIGSPKDGVMQCGHLFTRSHHSTRFSEINTWCQCSGCNYSHEFNFEPMRRAVESKLGRKRYDKLYEEFKQIKKWKSYELEELYEDTKNKLHALTEL